MIEVGAVPPGVAPAAPSSRSGPIRRCSSPRAPSSSPAPCSSGCRRWRSSTGPRDRLPRRARRASEQEVTYQYKGGIVDFVKHLNASKEPLFSKVAHYEDEDAEGGQTLDIAIQWNTGYYEGIHGYANGISTIEGGMHVEGFKTALTSVVNKYARAKNLLKEKDENLLGEDIREGITAIIVGEAARAAVRGPDQGQARQRPDALVRAEGHQRAARRVARGEPDRGQPARQEGASPLRRPAWPRRTRATPSAARPR